MGLVNVLIEPGYVKLLLFFMLEWLGRWIDEMGNRLIISNFLGLMRLFFWTKGIWTSNIVVLLIKVMETLLRIDIY